MEGAKKMNGNESTNDFNVFHRRVHAFDKNGKFEYTIHENMFASMFPELDRQVTFGTGKNGHKMWGSKKFTADFFDKENKIAYEIDGKSHDLLNVQVVDELKKRFLLSKGIKVVRIDNKYVESLFNKHAEEMKRFEQIFRKFFG